MKKYMCLICGHIYDEALGGALQLEYDSATGDTLGAIAKEHLGSASAYMKIFELNKDQLSDPDKIKVGQVIFTVDGEEFTGHPGDTLGG